MATLNEHTSVLAAILSDISDDNYTNFIYRPILSANECQQRHNEEMTLAAAVSTSADQPIPNFIYNQTHESRD